MNTNVWFIPTNLAFYKVIIREDDTKWKEEADF